MNDWTVVLFDLFVHPVHVAIMEAFDWIEEPFSPSQFFEMRADIPVRERERTVRAGRVPAGASLTPRPPLASAS